MWLLPFIKMTYTPKFTMNATNQNHPMISKFKYINHTLLFSQAHFPKPLKNPNKTVIHYLIHPKSSKITLTLTLKMSSWNCSSCTFLNPPSQKLSCQICQTPTTTTTTKIATTATTTVAGTSSSTATHKWVCKACTFLNSYSLTNCEICDTRLPTIDLDFTNDFVDSESSFGVGSKFFPLRKCTSSKLDFGFQDKVKVHVDDDDVDVVAQKGVCFSGFSDNKASNKRKFQDDGFSESSDAICKEDYSGAVTDPRLAEIVDDSECNVVLKRKRDPSDLVEKPHAFNEFRDVKSSKKQTTVLGAVGALKGSIPLEIVENGDVKNVSGTLKILSYNVWFRDELEGHLRMRAIGNLIHLHSPDVICFQEVNPVIYEIFQRSSWWKKYRCSVSFEESQFKAYFCMQLAKLPVKSFSSKPFSNTMMMRELCITQAEVNKNKSLVIATTHLESPCPGPPTWDQMYSKERVSQAKEAIGFLQQYPNVIFCGDMNWDDKQDGRFPFTKEWFDAWERLRPAELGYTYDTKSNKMLSGNRNLQKRLDRFICHLTDFRVTGIEMIGTEAIPGLEYKKEKKVRGKIHELMLPVYPSDHYGLILTVTTI